MSVRQCWLVLSPQGWWHLSGSSVNAGGHFDEFLWGVFERLCCHLLFLNEDMVLRFGGARDDCGVQETRRTRFSVGRCSVC